MQEGGASGAVWTSPPNCSACPSLSAGLEELDIAYNWLAYLPRSLASATRLRSLVVGQYSPELQLTAADVDSTLARMPLLRSLELRGSRQPEEVWQYLRQRLPHLKINSAGF